MRHLSLALAAAMFAGCGGSGGSGDATEDTPPDTGGDTGEDTVADTAVDEAPGEPIYGECTTDEDCEVTDPCSVATCDLHSLVCVVETIDADHDGYGPAEVGGEECEHGTDCDDSDPSVHPGVDDSLACDWIDNDCDGIAGMMDDDGDGFGDAEACPGELDCDDGDPLVAPGGVEACDVVDSDCDGSYVDAEGADDDGDGFLDEACGGYDCDDEEPAMGPGLFEICDGLDNDCNGEADDGGGISGGARVTDPGVGITLSSQYPATTWSGSEYGIAWTDARDGLNEIYFQRIARPGTRLGSNVLVTPDGANASRMAIAWSGSTYGIAWEDLRLGSGEIYLMRVAANGTPIGSETRLTVTAQSSARPDIAWTGSEWAIAYAETEAATSNDVVFLVRASPAGAKLGAEVRVSSGAPGYGIAPRIAWSGSMMGMTWTDDGGGTTRTAFALVSPEGAPAAEILVGDPVESVYLTQGIAWSGSEFGIAWTGGNSIVDVWFARISEAGVQVAPAQPIAAGTIDATERAWVEWTGSGYQVMWRETTYEIYRAGLAPDGTESGEIVHLDTTASGRDISPKAAEWDGTNMGVITPLFIGPEWALSLILLGECP